ncbi:MAG: helix-turn-helix domain-containing protein [Nitrososphaeria archaeon]
MLALRLRQEGRSQQEVAQLLGVSQQAISRWENAAESKSAEAPVEMEVVTNTTRSNSYQTPRIRPILKQERPNFRARVR